MDIKKFEVYTTLFARLYDEGKILVKWGAQSTGMRSKVDVETELSSCGEEGLTEQDFLKAAFSIISISKKISIGLDSELESDKHKIVSTIFLKNNKQLKDYILVQSSSRSNVFEDLDYEILTKRDKSDITKILTNTILVNLFGRDASSKADEPIFNKFAIELTENELEELITSLKGIQLDLNRLR